MTTTDIKERPILFSGEMQSESPWIRSEHSALFGTELRCVQGWVSQCGLWGLRRHELFDRYCLTHLPTGRHALGLPNHEMATAFIEELRSACDMTVLYIEGGKIKGIDLAAFKLMKRWAIECLGATHLYWDEWPGVAQGDWLVAIQDHKLG